MKKLIAVSTRYTQTSFEGRDSLSLDWHNFLSKVLPGFAWVMLPNVPASINLLCKKNIFSGIILSGGDDIGTYTERDIAETLLLNHACREQIPVIGICRGAQMINHYFGGQLEKINSAIHAGKRHNIILRHSPYSAEQTMEVNSYHNFGIRSSSLAKALSAFAEVQNENYTEGFFHCFLPIYGIMWHPERETIISESDKKFFQNIFRN